MEDKNYCMSSYLAFRYIEDINKNFYEGMCHEHFKPLPIEKRHKVKTAKDIDKQLFNIFKNIEGKKGIFLSGGMDSAILASYMPGCEAYTFRFLGGNYQKEELARAEQYAKKYNLKLHYVDITWDTVEKYLVPLLKKKKSPLHSIEPQLLQAGIQAKKDGVDVIILGEGCDTIFGGLDGLLSKDWTIEEFKKALCQIVLVEKTNKFSSNSSDFRWSYFVANKLLLIKILALK